PPASRTAARCARAPPPCATGRRRGGGPASPRARRRARPRRSRSARTCPSSCLQREDAARKTARLQILERGGELVERVAAGDELVDLQPAGQVEVREHREVAAGTRRPLAAAQDRPVLVGPVHDEVELRAELRDADDGERAARAERLE